MRHFYFFLGVCTSILLFFGQCKHQEKTTANTAKVDTTHMPIKDCGKELRDSINVLIVELSALESILSKPRPAVDPGLKKNGTGI